jgi:hypothetical protein
MWYERRHRYCRRTIVLPSSLRSKPRSLPAESPQTSVCRTVVPLFAPAVRVRRPSSSYQRTLLRSDGLVLAPVRLLSRCTVQGRWLCCPSRVPTLRKQRSRSSHETTCWAAWRNQYQPTSNFSCVVRGLLILDRSRDRYLSPRRFLDFMPRIRCRFGCLPKCATVIDSWFRKKQHLVVSLARTDYYFMYLTKTVTDNAALTFLALAQYGCTFDGLWRCEQQ